LLQNSKLLGSEAPTYNREGGISKKKKTCGVGELEGGRGGKGDPTAGSDKRGISCLKNETSNAAKAEDEEAETGISEKNKGNKTERTRTRGKRYAKGEKDLKG